MEYDHQHKHYAIYTAEREEHEQDDPTDTWHHAFLMLVDETDGTPTILQQLHFVDGENDMLTPNVREGISDPEEFPDRFKGVKVFKEEEGERPDLDQLRRSNINLSATMAQEWIEPNRYIGPLPDGYLIYLNRSRGQSPATPEANELG